MTSDLLTSFSNALADAVAAAAPSVVQVQGRRRPASGLVYADDVVLTMVRALGREDGLRVRRDDGQALDAELAGWDPTTSLAVLRVRRYVRRAARRRHRGRNPRTGRRHPGAHRVENGGDGARARSVEARLSRRGGTAGAAAGQPAR